MVFRLDNNQFEREEIECNRVRSVVVSPVLNDPNHYGTAFGPSRSRVKSVLPQLVCSSEFGVILPA